MLPQPSHLLSCLKCGHALISFDWMCLCKYNNANHCTLTYDHQIKYTSDDQIDTNHSNNQKLMINMDVQESPKKKIVLHTLHCRKCNEKVATVIKIKDEFTIGTKVVQLSEGFVCFRPEATFVKGLEDPTTTIAKKKWPDRKLPFHMIYEDIKSYLPSHNDNNDLTNQVVEPIVQTVLPNFLDEKNQEQYYPPSLLHSTPRDYQVEMYFQSLFTNSLICLPTGLGKTLVSVLLMKKMSVLNPEKLVAFVVNKIPLAFQQSDYYITETEDKSLVLCSQTRTAESIERLRKREVQVCFFTDGLLLNLFENRMLRPEDFSMVVFDEIHHGISPNSRYNLLGAAFRNSQSRVKITGLTASPLDFQQLEVSFKIDSVSYPFLTREKMREMENTASTKIRKTSMKQEQIQLISKFKEEVCLLNEQLLEYKINNLWHFGSFISIIGYLRLHIPPQYESISQKMLKFIGLMEMTNILGTKEALEYLESSKDLEYSKEKFSNITRSFSERFGVLESILNKTKDDSRILVFVKTKEMSFRLTRMLERKFKQFYPQRIVGQYGAGGMNYENEQRVLIEEFKNHECKLLVSTSVLEEGIDISDCNIVVLFDGNLSLRRIIQARGRARQKKSTFHLLIEEEEQNYYEQIEKEEKEMITKISLK
ncbi:predicted protein [Naegleria gruberi]|uniref:Predicted protein n=1 Tax=Naegleria gruberi TaxID=5762 RepID=D2VGF9_NAEGR|nr:uncharacterized protein NAEGRDRAFT_67962 [Naegleria gruberi]EFC44058.1 predicted protein [Naegleria gruberi]|eukprot:XP_002676802.1 predicted protein [Naegleria gruberi strain NEG-M]